MSYKKPLNTSLLHGIKYNKRNQKVAIGISQQFGNDFMQLNNKTKLFDSQMRELNSIQSSLQLNNNLNKRNDLQGILRDSHLILSQENNRYVIWAILTVGALFVAYNSNK